jgi:prepilin-type processing-associated H-X9-DG protein
MKPRETPQRAAAMTLMEVLVVIATLVFFIAIFLPALASMKRKHSHLYCMSNLKMIGVCYRVLVEDHDGKYPKQMSVANEGVIELVDAGNVAAYFRVMSNELVNPEILICPEDIQHISAANFASLENSNISYFITLDTVETQPQSLLSGDDNLMVNGKRVHSGILNLHPNDLVTWTKERHQGAGNILLGDGSVQQASSADLTSPARFPTNRLAIP